MIEARVQRGMLLFRQGRYDMAENELRAALAANPDDAEAHGFLALCLIEQSRFREATAEAGEALRLGAGSAHSHYILAFVYHRRQRLKEAQQAIDQAIQLDPYVADYFSLLAHIWLDWRDWGKALAAAEKGLEIDPEHVGCTNLRAIALVKLGRRADAGRTIDAALARDPEDALTHANRGWSLLHEGKHVKAMEHFREALRLDPTMDWARSGIVEALKARHFIYRWMLMYFLWMARLSGRAQWAIIIGGYVGYRLLRALANSQPALEPMIYPILIAYSAFVILTWLSMPAFNLLLRLNRFGRLALSREQVVASNCIGGLLATAIGCAVVWLASGAEWPMDLAIVTGLLTIPAAGIFVCPSGWPRRAMVGGTLLMAFVGVMHVICYAQARSLPPPEQEVMFRHGNAWFNYFIFGMLAMTVAGNALAATRVKH